MLTLAALGLAGAYVALSVAARLWYPSVLFPAPRLERVPAAIEPMLGPGGEARLVELPHPDGTTTRALAFPAPPGARTVVFFHGNGETMFDAVPLALDLKARGLGVVLVEYRGYGLSYGPPPSEAMLYEDGEAALAWLDERGVPKDRVALFGMSLGTGVASELARRGHGARLVLLSPFTSVTAMAKRTAPFLPVSLILKHSLDTLGKAGEIRQPTLVAHGDRDEIIPFDMGEAVAAAIPGARFMRVEGGHHNDLLAERAGAPSADALLDAIARHLGE